MTGRLVLAVLFALVLAGCSTRNSFELQADRVAYASRYERDIAIAHEAWDILSDRAQSSKWQGATVRYNEAVLNILEQLRRESKDDGQAINMERNYPFVIVDSLISNDRSPQLYEDLIPCEDIETTEYLAERVTVKGMGVPVAGHVKINKVPVKDNVIMDNGNVHTLTVIINFDKVRTVNGKPTLRLIPRLRQESIHVGPRKIRQPLAADFSAPIAAFIRKTDVDRGAFFGFLNPARGFSYMGLYFSEPYDPDKIPIIFTHGLMSRHSTFANLTNRLWVDPLIRKHYQFWFYAYPTSVPWTQIAYRQRNAVNEGIKRIGAEANHKKINAMVMVGHSMGGLITRLNNATKPWAVVASMLRGQEVLMNEDYRHAYNSSLTNPVITPLMRQTFIFEPFPQTKRIVFMATPHRGSDVADSWMGRLGIGLTELPGAFVDEARRLSALSSDILLFNPSRAGDELKSISQLSPESPFIRGVQKTYPRKGIPVHSIIGDRGRHNSPRSSDGIVPYWSSHLDWAVSEKIVNSGHSVQDNLESALEMRRILREHLSSQGISTKEPPLFDSPPVIWQQTPREYYFKQRAYR